MSLTVALVALARAADEPPCVTKLTQDLNCNGIDASEEFDVDPKDPECALHIDPLTGFPYASADYYYDYSSFRCAYFLPDLPIDHAAAQTAGNLGLQLLHTCIGFLGGEVCTFDLELGFGGLGACRFSGSKQIVVVARQLLHLPAQARVLFHCDSSSLLARLALLS